MVCIKCGHEIAAGAKFCSHCGVKVIAGEAAQIKPAEEKPIYAAEVKGMLRSARLAVYSDRVELITGSVQKTVYEYASLMAVKKGLDRIVFVTADGSSESCVVGRKNIHEAYLYIEKAAAPYIEERKNSLLARGVKYSFVSSPGIGMAGGILDVMDDRVEFRGRSGQSEVLSFQNVKAAGCSSMGLLSFALLDGSTKTYTVDKEMREEVLAFLQRAVAPYVEERRKALLAEGIYYSFPSSQGQDSGTLNILDDRLEYQSGSGRSEAVFFQDVREVKLFMGTLEVSLVNGMSKTFTVDKDVRDEVLSFVENAISPYVTERIAGFGLSFGIDERIEINEERGVFHIIRQGGREITAEYQMRDLVKCECVEHGASGEKVSYVGVVLGIHTDQDDLEAKVWFGDFALAMSRMNKKYDRYLAEVSRLMDYLEDKLPECELIRPVVLETVVPEISVPGITGALPEIVADTGVAAAETEAAVGRTETAVEKDQFGIKKYIEGVSGYISECRTPMTIAIQGSQGGGQSSIMKMLADSLEGIYKENLIWFSTWQFAQFELGEQLPMLVGNKLISQLGGAKNAAGSDRAVKLAKGLINVFSGFVSQGGTDGQMLTDALFKDNSMDSLEKLVRVFSEQIETRIGGEKDKVIIFVDDLDGLAPAKEVELLEALRNFLGCRGCVFVVAADYDSIISGIKERYGGEFGDSKGKNFLDKLFQVSFRVPVSGYNIQNYVKEKLEQLGIYTDDEAELGFYADLIRYSVGGEPEGMERLFNSFLLLKKLADSEIYESKYRRLMLFALICMQSKFRGVYDFIVRMKDKVTPEFLLGLCGNESEALLHAGLGDKEKTEFLDFAKVFCDIIDTDQKEGISELECSVFAEVLEFSSITYK